MERFEVRGDMIIAMDESTGHDLSCETTVIKRSDGIIEILSIDYFKDGLRIVTPPRPGEEQIKQ